MADNFAQYYTGNMAPPLKLPGGGYAPAPSAQMQMTPEEIYQGIYGEPLQTTGLTSRPVQTYKVTADNWDNPTRQLPQITADARAAYGGGIGAGASGSLKMLPNQPSGSLVAFKDQSRLPQTSRDAELMTGYQPLPQPNAAMAAINGATKPNITPMGGARGQLGAMGRASGSLAFGGGNDVLDLSFEPMSETSGQNLANSSGRPIRAPSGAIYYPSNTATNKVRAPMQPVSQQMAGQQRQSGLGGLLAGLFGGGQGGQPQQGGGGLGGLLSGMGGGQGMGAPGAGGGYIAPSGSFIESITGANAAIPKGVGERFYNGGY